MSTDNLNSWFRQLILSDNLNSWPQQIIDWLIDWLIRFDLIWFDLIWFDWLFEIDGLIYWLIEWLIDCLFNWSLGCVIDWLAESLIEWLLFPPNHSPLSSNPYHTMCCLIGILCLNGLLMLSGWLGIDHHNTAPSQTRTARFLADQAKILTFTFWWMNWERRSSLIY